MHDRSRRYALLDFTEKELRVVALRTSGIKPEEIARIMNAKIDTTRWRLRMAMRKAGIEDIVVLTRWAIENALDVPLEPECPQDIPRMESWRDRSPRVRIKQGRARRLKLPLTSGKMPNWKSDAESVAKLSRQLKVKIPRSSRRARKD